MNRADLSGLEMPDGFRSRLESRTGRKKLYDYLPGLGIFPVQDIAGMSLPCGQKA